MIGHPKATAKLSAEEKAPASGPANPALSGKRAVVLLYSYYPSDVRPRRAAEAMALAGMRVELICLRDAGEPRRESIAGVDVLRLPMRRQRGSKISYVARYATFLTLSFLILSARSVSRRCDLVHVHNMPDVLVFSSLLAKFRGARVLLDLHDPMPEVMGSVFGLTKGQLLVRLLKWCEQRSIAYADAVVTPNVAFRDLFVSRGAPRDKVEIVMNSPRSEVFDPDRLSVSRRRADRFTVMFHGTIVERHGLHTAVRALALLRDVIPFARLDIYGAETPYLRDTVLPLARSLGMAGVVGYCGSRSEAGIAHAVAECDLGVIPNLRNGFTELNMPTRIFEYLALGKPVIAPDTKGIRDYFGPNNMLFFEPGNVNSLSQQIRWVYENPVDSAHLVEEGRKVHALHQWDLEKAKLLEVVANLLRH